MKKIILSLIFLCLFCQGSFANSDIITSLQEGGKLVFLRHALAPGGGDPENFDINDCSTQRNLNSTGIEQAKRIGNFFKDNNIPVEQVFSSEWCRCKDTAKNAFQNYKTFNALNSFFLKRFAKNRDKQIKDLKAFVKKWHGKDNLIFVTHYVVISEMLNDTARPGEIIVSDKNFNVLGTIETD